MRHVLFAPLLSALLGCGAGSGVCATDDLAVGRARAEIGGDAWEAAGAAWALSGTSVQVLTGPADGWRITMVAQWTPDGVLLSDAVQEGVFPITAALGDDAEGGWAVLYPDEGATLQTASAAAGTLTITDIVDGVLTACFDFTAAEGVQSVPVVSGAVVAEGAG
jgi:hypothetical protein